MTMSNKLTAAAAFAIACAGVSADAASTQIGDLRLTSNAYSGSFTHFDPTTPVLTTRAAGGAPVQVNSDFIGVSQEINNAAADTGTDIGLRTYSSSTVIKQLSRYAVDPDGPGAAGGPQRIGIAQWSFDLTPLDGYLSGNSLNLTALDLRLVADPSDDTKQYDVYLSYTNPAESIALASVSTTSADDNYDNFWLPAQSSAEGAVANGTHKIIELDHTGNLDTTVDLAGLYAAGVKDFNLIITTGEFFSNRTIGIQENSGLSIDTAPVPEPTSLALLALGGLMVARRRRG